jgi:hypothetical protein
MGPSIRTIQCTYREGGPVIPTSRWSPRSACCTVTQSPWLGVQSFDRGLGERGERGGGGSWQGWRVVVTMRWRGVASGFVRVGVCRVRKGSGWNSWK